MSKVYLYDDKFSSLINLISFFIKNNTKPDFIKSEKNYESNLIDEPIFLRLERENLNLSRKIIKTCYYAYLSDDKDKELIIYYFIKNALKYKSEVYYHRNLICVNKIIKLVRRVRNEVHKLKGFLRFKEMKNGFYYAEINPSNNIIKIISNHFAKRMPSECWIIKDVNRNIYSIYFNKKIVYLTSEFIVKLNLDLSEVEQNIENLWKSFFKSVSIKERKNKRCQMNFMPKKYWKYIIEMENEK